MKVVIPIAALAVSFAGPASVAEAATLELTPGKWETTTTMTAPMYPSPRVKTETECMRETGFDPKKMVENSEDCRLTHQEVQGDTMTWQMECAAKGGKITGDGTFTANATTGHGSFKMHMEMGGQTMTMETAWKARRLGDCD